ncbi:MAG TPA: DoxX family membrane protein [Acidobacteriaceae bacterium]
MLNNFGPDRIAYRAGLLAQSVVYAASGVNHFWHATFYEHIMPDHYAHPAALVKLSGVAEILGGLGLLPRLTRRFSAVGIAVMLVVFFDVHVFMLRHAERFPEAPAWVLWARIPLQLVLIAWALRYAWREPEHAEL